MTKTTRILGSELNEDELDTKTLAAVEKACWRSLFVFTTSSHLVSLCAAILLSIISGIAIPTLSIFLGKLFDAFTEFGMCNITGPQLVHEVYIYGTGLVILGAVSGFLNAGFFASWLVFGELQASSARSRIFEVFLNKDVEWFDSRKSGIDSLSNRLQTLVRNIQLATSQPLGFAVQYSVTMLAALGLALFYSWRVTLVTLATTPISALVLAGVSTRMRPRSAAQADHLTRASNSASSAISSIETVKCLNGQALQLHNYLNFIKSAGNFYLACARLNALQIGFARFMILSMFVQGFWYGSHLVNSESQNAGNVLTAFWASLMAIQTLEQILPQFLVLEDGRAAGASMRNLLEFSNFERRIMEDCRKLVPKNCQGEIRVDNVFFAYPSRPSQPVLKGLSLLFAAEQTTIILGRNGSGKSTLSSLLIQLYQPDKGDIRIDGMSLHSLDNDWIRNNITLVQQGNVLFNETIFRNVACGRKDHKRVSRQEVQSALGFACMFDTVIRLPQGLDTLVGEGGKALSGGQRQRIALARARLRNTPILILDESTSALDLQTKKHVLNAIRAWRKGKTTIIITHDVSQIEKDDYIYVFDDGKVVQQGSQCDLEADLRIWSLHGTKRSSGASSEYQPNVEKRLSEWRCPTNVYKIPLYGQLHGTLLSLETELRISLNTAEAPDRLPFLRDARSRIAKLRSKRRHSTSAGSRPYAAVSKPLELKKFKSADLTNTTIRQELFLEALTTHDPALPDFRNKRFNYMHKKTRYSDSLSTASTLVEETSQKSLQLPDYEDKPDLATLKTIFKTVWPALPMQKKLLLIFGFSCAFIHAAATPVVSWLFSQLLSTFYDVAAVQGSRDARTWSVIVLLVALIDALASFMMHIMLENCGQHWVNHLRQKAFSNILGQPLDFFSGTENQTPSLVEYLDRNAEEMRNLLGRFAGLMFVAVSLMSVAIVWSIIISWRLTLVALGSVPFLYSVTRLFDHVSSRWETRSNDTATKANLVFNGTFANIHTVRALTLEGYFHEKYIKRINHVFLTGLYRAGYSGLFYGLSDSGIIFVTALVFFYGTRLIANGTNSTTEILSVFTMLLFGIANVNGMMAYIPQINSSRSTATQLLRLAHLPPDASHEVRGSLRLNKFGTLSIENVDFAYPSRFKAPVLRSLSLSLSTNSSLALVGASGCGKSTIAALLLNLYTPTLGHIYIDGQPLDTLHTPWIRDQIAIVPQHPTLFPTSIAANIAYPMPPTATDSDADANKTLQTRIQTAAQTAGIHDFITSLPEGYSTILNGTTGTTNSSSSSGLSGGQTQRLAIARALFRRPRLLILDEATSGLDVATAGYVRDLVRRLPRQQGCGVLAITHDEGMMRACGEVAVLRGGAVVERGKFERLVGVEGVEGGELARMMG